ncbi:OSJNBa0042P21.21 [Oryza sativa (japonica cultivar-group)]
MFKSGVRARTFHCHRRDGDHGYERTPWHEDACMDRTICQDRLDRFRRHQESTRCKNTSLRILPILAVSVDTRPLTVIEAGIRILCGNAEDPDSKKQHITHRRSTGKYLPWAEVVHVTVNMREVY